MEVWLAVEKISSLSEIFAIKFNHIKIKENWRGVLEACDVGLTKKFGQLIAGKDAKLLRFPTRFKLRQTILKLNGGQVNEEFHQVFCVVARGCSV